MENVGKSDPAIDGPLSPRTTLSGNTLADEKDLEAQCVDNGEENIRCGLPCDVLVTRPFY